MRKTNFRHEKFSKFLRKNEAGRYTNRGIFKMSTLNLFSLLRPFQKHELIIIWTTRKKVIACTRRRSEMGFFSNSLRPLYSGLWPPLRFYLTFLKPPGPSRSKKVKIMILACQGAELRRKHTELHLEIKVL
jgi:hypothetical protein